MLRSAFALGAAVALAAAPNLGWAVPSETKCIARKERIAAAYLSCRLNADAKAMLGGFAPDFATCNGRFDAKWAKAEASGSCPASLDATALKAQLAMAASEAVAVLNDPLAATCQQSLIACQTEQDACLVSCLGGDGACGPGCAASDPECVSNCFIDPGDGTIVDSCTGLQWEGKIATDGVPNTADPHDADNRYSWGGICLTGGARCQPSAEAEAACRTQTNAAFWSFGCDRCAAGDADCDVDPFSVGAPTTIWAWVSSLNDCSFGGHHDWRLATVNRDGDAAELETILDVTQVECAGGTGPCIDPLIGPTSHAPAGDYWSATTVAGNPDLAWFVSFGDTLGYGPGVVANGSKNTGVVRAVRVSGP